jgi:hypothetical protein
VSDIAAKALDLEDRWDADSLDRDDPNLVKVVETLGKLADGPNAKLCVVEIPDNTTDWELDDYDGMESIIYVVDGKIYHA